MGYRIKQNCNLANNNKNSKSSQCRKIQTNPAYTSLFCLARLLSSGETRNTNKKLLKKYKNHDNIGDSNM